VAAGGAIVAGARVAAGHTVRLGCVAGGLLARRRAVGAFLAGLPGRPGSEAGARVAALGQVEIDQHPQLPQAAGQSAAVQRRRERIDVRLGSQHILGRQFPAGQERVTGVFPARLHPLPVGAGLLLAPLERLRIQLHRHRGRPAGQLVIPQPRRQDGQDLIGVGGVGVGQALGGFPDETGPVAVGEPGAEGGPGAGQPGWQVSGHVHLVPGRAGGGDQFHAELGVGEFPVPAAARHLPCRRVRQLGLAAAGELRDRGQLLPGGAGRQPAGRGHRADDLVVGEPAQVPGGLLGQRGEHRPRAHRIRGPVPREHLAAQPVRAQQRGQLCRVHVRGVTEADSRRRALDLPLLGNPRPARLQVRDIRRHLRVAVPVIVPRRVAGRRLLAVWPGTRERGLGHCKLQIRIIMASIHIYTNTISNQADNRRLESHPFSRSFRSGAGWGARVTKRPFGMIGLLSRGARERMRAPIRSSA
jgi:hypothetical protein